MNKWNQHSLGIQDVMEELEKLTWECPNMPENSPVNCDCDCCDEIGRARRRLRDAMRIADKKAKPK
jgi:hypothetical protein